MILSLLLLSLGGLLTYLVKKKVRDPIFANVKEQNNSMLKKFW